MKAQNEGQPLTIPNDKQKARLKFRHYLVNMTTALGATVSGLFLGAVITFVGGWCVFSLLYRVGIVGDVSCGGGNALGMLLLIGGANIGSVCGGIFGFAHPVYRKAS